MGYRFHLYTVAKEELNKIKDMSYEDLCKEYGMYNGENSMWFSLYDLKSAKEIHDLGKDIDKLLYDGLEDNCHKIFTNKDVIDTIENEHSFGFLNAYSFKIFLEACREKVLAILREEASSAAYALQGVKSRIMWIEENHAYNFDIDNPHIQTSWLYEYTLFDLIHYYKTIDWDSQSVMFYAY